ncbi:MAG: AAA family ATPase [Polyangiales bacterium]
MSPPDAPASDLAIEGFERLEELHRSNATLVLRGVRSADGAPVVLKTTPERRPARAQIARAVREQRMTWQAQGERVVKLLGAIDHQGAPVLVLEDFGGVSLDRVDLAALPLAARLDLALGAARAVEAAHARGVIHKDVNPSNLVWDRATGRLELIDFGLATDLRREGPAPERAALLEGTLGYIAPEQTGRTNLAVDRRSDLYALGATLYELYAGRRPFEGDDPLELAHAHLARTPAPLRSLDPGLPAPLCAVVERLLEKDPARRYQTASGLVADLARCAEEFRLRGDVAEFALGARDRSGALEVPQRLYGRDDEVRALQRAFERAADGGRELALVAGPAGIGKTLLVRELHRPIAERRGELLEGKFDQFRLGVPYAPLGHAFGRFLRRVLTRDDATVARWRATLGAAVGRNGAVLVEILPELESLLGPQEPPQPLSPAEAENRFHLVFRQLVEAIASPEHPIALFLDDLQWADVPTLRLLERLVTDADCRHLLVVGAYRDGEVDAAHPMSLTVDAVRRAGVSATAVSLGPLSLAHVRALLRDTFGQDDDALDELASLCAARTGANPFFLGRFVESLEARGAASWDAAAQRWTWDLRAAAALAHTDNVVDFLLDRLGQLPPATRAALQQAACVGDTFDLRLLADVTDRSLAAVQADLRPAVRAELVAPLGDAWIFDAADDPAAVPDEACAWRFVHDRILQAAYGTLDASEAARAHHRLGHLIARRHAGEPEGPWLFEVVNHLNRAAALADTPEARAELARRNLDAGRLAMRAAAFVPAAEYFDAGIALLPGDAWSAHYELALGLHADAAECAYVNARFDQLAARVAAVRDHARSLLDRTKALEIDMEGRMARDDLRGAVALALQALAQLGFPMPEAPGDAEIGAAVARAMGALAGLTPADIERLPDVADPAVAAAQRILVRASSLVYFVAPALLPIIACELVVTSVQRGLSTATPFGFAVYGIVLNAAGMMAQAYEYGELAGRLIDRWDDRRLEARTRLVINNHVCPWIAPLSERLDALREAYSIGRDTGDFEYAAICGQCYATNAFSAGRELGRLLEEADAFTGFMRNYAQRSILRLHLPLVQLARALAGLTDDPARLDGPGFDEAEALSFAEASGSASLVFVVLSDVLVARYHFAGAREAMDVADRARPHQHGAVSTWHLSNFHTYAPLAAARLHDEAPESDRPALLARIDESLAVLRTWAAAGPANHRHRLLLVEAERARVTGDLTEAAARYHEALEAARLTPFVNDEALIAERAARFHLARGGVGASIGRAFLEDASFAYQRWGAARKVERLAGEFPRLLGARPAARGSSSSELDLDALAAVRAARAISAEIELDRLLLTLFRTMVEAAGAQRALLLLERDGRWELAAEGDAAGEPTLPRAPLDALDPARHPLAVIRYVLRTGEAVLVDDASRPGALTDDDPYTRARGARSVLCLPGRHRGAVTSALYLEHDQTSGVFTAARGELLELLMSQAAVSLDNARLFEAKSRLTRAQSRFVPHQFLEALGRRHIAEVALGDAVTKTLSVLFSDLRDFTPMVERTDAGAVIRLLNDYFAAMEPCIVDVGGFIDSFNGDEIMALFDAAPERAVRAGVAMQAALARFNAASGRSLRMGVGVNTGPVVLGTVGGRDRIKCGVVGDAVNVASRFEGLTKRYGAAMIVGAATRDALPEGAFSLRAIDRVAVKGKRHAQVIYEVLDAAPDADRAERERARPAFEAALARFHARAFEAARRGFEACRAAAPSDPVPAIYVERCMRFEAEAPPPDWEGVERLG